MNKKTHLKGGNVGEKIRGQQVTANTRKFFQLKYSILDNSKFLRQVKAGFTNRENFGRIISAIVAKSKTTMPNSVPESCIVYGKAERKILVVSRYLEGDNVQTLDDSLLVQGEELAEGKKHFSIDYKGKAMDTNCYKHFLFWLD